MTLSTRLNEGRKTPGLLAGIVAPWFELAEDVAASLVSMLGIAGGLSLAHAHEEFVFGGCSASRCGVGAAVLELAEDIVDVTRDGHLAMLLPIPVLATAFSALALCTVLASGSGAMILLLSRVSIHITPVCVMISLCMLTGACYTWFRHPGAADRVPQRRAAVCLGISGCFYFALGCIAFPHGWFPHIGNPHMMVHFVLDMLCNPLIILNFGYLAGFEGSEVFTIFPLPLLSSLGGAAAAIGFNSGRSAVCMLLSMSCLALASRQLLIELPLCARNTSHQNAHLVFVSSSMFVCPLAVSLLMQSLGVVHLIGLSAQIHILSGCDFFSKLAVCHMTTRSLSCLQLANAHITERIRRDRCI